MNPLLTDLSPARLRTLLEARRLELKKLLLKIARHDQSVTQILKVVRVGGHYKYYLKSSKSDNKPKYVSLKNRQLLQEVAYAGYSDVLCSKIEAELKQLESILSTYKPLDFPSIYDSLHPGRKLLIPQIPQSREEFIKQWLEVKWKPMESSENTTFFTTISGQRVRSKSEVFIANALSASRIPFRYEFPVKLITGSKSRIVWPDFICLRPDSGTEVLWEHFGLMDNPKYALRTVEKLNMYQQNGWIPGKNLICTWEASTRPLTPEIINSVISQNLLAVS